MSEQVITNIPIPYEALAAFCQRWRIQEVALFGSALRDDFSSESDVDLLVRFRDGNHYTFRDLVAMQDELETLFGHPIDLIDKQAVQASPNYIRRRQILQTAKVIYAER